MKPHICIAIPTTGSVKTKTLFSIVSMLKHATFKFSIVTKESCYMHWNREHMTRKAIDSNCTHILFLDSDMVFEPDSVNRLLARDKDIIGVPYNIRTRPAQSTHKIKGVDGQIINEEFDDGTGKVAAVATGFMLIKLDVFKKMKEPWFDMPYKPNVNFEDTQDIWFVGEDIWFCEQARKAGFDIFIDYTVKVGHVGDFIY